MKETAEVILDAAERRMRWAGYTALSFRDLAEDAKIKSSSGHYYFRRKEDLGVALIERYDAQFFAALDRATSSAGTAKLKAFCRVYENALKDDAMICLCGMLGAESMGLPEPVRAAVEAFFKRNIDWLVDAMPAEISTTVKEAKAQQTVATLQGAMMLATSMKNVALFDGVVKNILAGGLPEAQVSANSPTTKRSDA